MILYELFLIDQPVDSFEGLLTQNWKTHEVSNFDFATFGFWKMFTDIL